MPQGAIDLFRRLANNDYGFFQKITSLDDIMTTDVKRLTLDDTYEQAVELLRHHGFHHAPVIADDGDVVGVVSDRDLLRHRPPLIGTAAEGDNDHLARNTCVARFMTRGTIAVSSSSTPAAAIQQMLDYHVDCVLVHDQDKQLEGIVTPRDFMKMVSLFHQVCTRGPELERFRLVDMDLKRGLPLDSIFSRGTRSIRDVMSKEVITLVESDTIATAMDLMKQHEIRHIPVVDESLHLQGMVSDRDILRFLSLPVPPADPKASPCFRGSLFAVEDTRQVQQRVTTIMSRDPLALKDSDLLTDAVELFVGQTLNGLAVLDDADQVCGILTTTDILRVFLVTLQIGSLLENGGSASCDTGSIER